MKIFLMKSESFPPLTDYETTTFKPQKGKDIIKVIHVTFHVCSKDELRSYRFGKT